MEIMLRGPSMRESDHVVERALLFTISASIERTNKRSSRESLLVTNIINWLVKILAY